MRNLCIGTLDANDTGGRRDEFRDTKGQMMKAAAKNYWFPFLVIFIASVSLYDTFLIVRFSDSIRVMEENPFGVMLLDIAGGEVGVFVRAKLAGTLLVVCVLVTMYRLRSRKTLPVTTSVAAYQSALLTYLTLV